MIYMAKGTVWWPHKKKDIKALSSNCNTYTSMSNAPHYQSGPKSNVPFQRVNLERILERFQNTGLLDSY